MSNDNLARAFARPNNFDFLRLVAATMVLFGHSFNLVRGPNVPGDPLSTLISPFLPWNEAIQDIAVNAFFVISGFLVASSFQRSEKLWSFVKARILRIFPACIVCSIVTVMAMYMVSSTSFEKYATSSETFRFLYLNAFIIDIQYNLPGVFEENPYPKAVNGSLWTLPLEIRCYIVLTLLGIIGLFYRKSIVVIFGFVFSASLIIPGGTEWISGSDAKARVILFFLAGTLFYLLRSFIPAGPWGTLLLISLIILFVVWPDGMPGEKLIYIATFSLGVLLLAFCPYLIFINLRPIGDWSYGLYLYAFPIQQYFVSVLPGTFNGWTLTLVAGSTTAIFAAASWHLVEKRALMLRKVRPDRAV